MFRNIGLPLALLRTRIGYLHHPHISTYHLCVYICVCELLYMLQCSNYPPRTKLKNTYDGLTSTLLSLCRPADGMVFWPCVFSCADLSFRSWVHVFLCSFRHVPQGGSLLKGVLGHTLIPLWRANEKYIVRCLYHGRCAAGMEPGRRGRPPNESFHGDGHPRFFIFQP